MNSTINIFKKQLENLRKQIKPDEYVKVEICGFHAIEYMVDGESLVIHIRDAVGIESVIVCPESHFTARLEIAKKQEPKKEIGFKIEGQAIKIEL